MQLHIPSRSSAPLLLTHKIAISVLYWDTYKNADNLYQQFKKKEHLTMESDLQLHGVSNKLGSSEYYIWS